MADRTPRPIRCGWCIAGDHENCAATIGTAHGPWFCPCNVPIRLRSGEVMLCNDPRVRKPRCTACRRRGVEVDSQSICLDRDGCHAFRTERRASNRAAQVLDEIAAEQAEHAPRQRRGPREPREKVGECVCCGEATRGGKFLPGHDARYVSQQAAAYLAADTGGVGAREIYDAMEALGPALHAKFIKRVERLRANQEAQA